MYPEEKSDANFYRQHQCLIPRSPGVVYLLLGVV